MTEPKKKFDFRDCNHDYFTNEDGQEECSHCTLLRSTIEAEHTEDKLDMIPDNHDKSFTCPPTCETCYPEETKRDKCDCGCFDAPGQKFVSCLCGAVNLKDMKQLHHSCEPEETEAWEGRFWQLVEAEGVGSDIRFMQHIRDFIAKERTQAAEAERVKIGKLKREAYMRGYKEGKQSVLDEMAEERKKFTQGFSYRPKKRKIEEAIQK